MLLIHILLLEPPHCWKIDIVITGTNQENAAYPSGLCAERTTLILCQFSISRIKQSKTLAIAARTENDFLDTPIPPCGACRQVLLETEKRYGKPMRILLYSKTDIYILENVSGLLPLSFDGKLSEMIPTIRLHSQQLINPVFNNPKDLVSWMGGIQAQDYTMSKWAIGIRLKAGNLQTVNEALAKGDILRIHVMRPTWHYVAAEDIRWMLKLSSRRIITANDSFAKSRGQDISVDIYNKANRLLEKALAGHNHLTKQEIDNVFKEGGLETNERLSNRFLIHAEAEGLICSGADKK